MKSSIYLFLRVLLLAILLNGCSKDKKEDEKYKAPLTGKLVNRSACKGKSSVIVADTVKNISCVKYSFELENNRVLMKHINSGFNCCPEICCGIFLEGDTIFIQEIEIMGICGCLCLYDLDIEINGVDPKCYQVKIIEPYCDNQEPLIFEMNLTENNSGIYCVQRLNYPWGD
jgi:hypothetical protein